MIRGSYRGEEHKRAGKGVGVQRGSRNEQARGWGIGLVRK